MRRHAWTWMAALAVLALLASACGGDDGGGGGGETAGCPVDALDDHDPSDGKVEVVLWHSYVAETRDTLISLAEEFNASQDTVEVRVESQGQSYEELQRKYTESIPSGDLPGIAILEDTVTQFMADSGTIVPGGACFEASGQDLDDYLPLAVDYYTVDGVLQAASANLSTVVLYYNKEHFRRAGLDPEAPPQTLEELQTAAQAIQDAGVTQQPFVMNMQPWFIEHWLTGVGEPVVDNDNGRGDGDTTAGAFDNPGAQTTFDWLQGMQDAGLLNPVPGTEGQFAHYFAVGLEQASMTFETSTAVTTIDAFLEGDLDPEDVGLDVESLPAANLDIGVAQYPGIEEAGVGQVGGGVWYIPNTTDPEVQAGAWQFISFVNEPAQQVRWNLEGSYLPFNQLAVEDPELQAAWNDTRKGRWLSTAYEGLLASDPEFPGPLIGPYDRTRDAIREAIDRVIFEGTAPGDAIAGADEAITEAVERYNEETF